MIQNIWGMVEIYCNHRHEKPIKMEIQEGPHSLFYACPKYHPENRTADERACSNRINLIDYEAMINHVSDILMGSMLNNSQDNLTNYAWSSKGIDFKIIEHTKDKIKILMTNKKAIR